MLKTLVKKQLAEIFRSYFYDAKKNKARSKGATAVYITLFAVLIVGVLGGMFTFVALALCMAMAEAGADWLYFAFMGLLGVLLGAFGSVFNTYSGLYLARDNDLLLSMPIPTGTIMTARLAGVYLVGLMYSAVVTIPAVAVYWICLPVTLRAVLGGIWFVLLVSVLVLLLSAALGWVVAKLSTKLRHKSFVTVAASLLFFALYYVVVYRAQDAIGALVANAAAYSAVIKADVYPLYLFGQCATGDIGAVLAVTAVTCALFALMWTLISRSFLRLATSSGRTERREYRESAAKVRGIGAALFAKEMGRFVSSPNYMLNCGLGVVMLPVLAIVVLIKGGELIPAIAGAIGDAKSVPTLLTAGVCIAAGMNDMAAPSVSLEGKNLWLVQSLPVTPWQVLRAKLNVQLALTELPALIAAVCVCLACRCTVPELLLSAAVTASVVLFNALFALTLGVKLPNLAWTSEIMPIKQSMGVVAALLGAMLYPLLLAAAYFTLGQHMGYAGVMAAFAAFTLALAAALYTWLKTRGSASFAAL